MVGRSGWGLVGYGSDKSDNEDRESTYQGALCYLCPFLRCSLASRASQLLACHALAEHLGAAP